MKQIIAVLLSLTPIVTNARASSFQNCEMNTDQIMESYNQILDSKNSEESLQCLLAIHRNGSGILKSMAASALRPILGGRALLGRTIDSKVKSVVKRLETRALGSDDLIHNSFVAQVSEGNWGFYDLFCNIKNQSFCTMFLPDERQIGAESSIEASSSLILLRTAYLSLNGSDQRFVEQRLRSLYQTISKKDALKRKTIEQIHDELFKIRLPLSSLS